MNAKAKAESGIVNIHGREYQTVALRIRNFRTDHPNWCVSCDVIARDLDCVVMRCVIADETGRTIATGYAEEFRKASTINKTSALENCETSAIGRALAAAGYGGTEFASANEVQHAIEGKPEVPAIDETETAIVQEWIDTISGCDTADALAEVGKGIAGAQVSSAGKVKLRAAFAAQKHAIERRVAA